MMGVVAFIVKKKKKIVDDLTLTEIGFSVCAVLIVQWNITLNQLKYSLKASVIYMAATKKKKNTSVAFPKGN